MKLFFTILICMFLLTSCGINDKTSEDNSLNTAKTEGAGTVTDENDEAVGKKIETESFYKIVKNEKSAYVCYLYNDSKEVVLTVGPVNKQPRVEVIDHIIKVTVSSGPQLSTKYTYYYDTDDFKLSQPYYAVTDEYMNYVAVADGNIVKILHMFSGAEAYTFTDFSNELSPCAEPISEVQFIDEGKSVRVKYLSGDDYKEVTQVFELN